MKIKMLQMFALIVAAAAMGSSVLAQDRSGAITPADKYMISAQAGGVNFVEGDVTVLRKDGRSGPLFRRDHLNLGDVVSTSSTGKAEILLNPGSYLRLGSNSKFSFRTTSLDDLQISLTSGSAIFEVLATDNFTVSIFTPKASLTVVQTGVYRVDLMGDGTGTLSVVDGKAEVGDYPPTVVTKGRKTNLGTSDSALAKFDRGKRDELADWSRNRGKELVKMSTSLQNPAMKNTLAMGFRNGRWNVYNSFGLWVLNPYTGMYCFLSYGPYLSSPYGYDYGLGLSWYGFPRYYYYPPQYTPPPVAPPVDTTRVALAPTGEMPSDPKTRPKPLEESMRFTQPPPFTQLERHRGDLGGGRATDPFGSSKDSGSFNFPSNNTPSSSSSVSMPQMTQAPIIVSAPVTRDSKPIDH